jgi:hypothetical protein
LEEVLSLLRKHRCSAYREACWAYEFDVQTRVFFYPRGMPNTIATTFAGNALLDAYEFCGLEHCREEAQSAAEFFLRRVPQSAASRGAFFGYLPDDATPIHNSNMLVCGFLARLGALTSSPALLSRAAEGALFTLSNQRQDGSWPYGELPQLSWVDGFHTGYVLEALMICEQAQIGAGTELSREIQAAIDLGLHFYATRLFERDGTPKYYSCSLYPIDTQAAAQGVQTFAIASMERPQNRQQMERILDFTLSNLRRNDGSFLFQRHRWRSNGQPHMRWVIAPMLLALANVLRTCESHGPREEK